jgi:hypothetical protein
MNSFRVIKEQTHKHKKDTLYVLIFKDGNSFGVDVTNSTNGFGRIVLDSKEHAEYVFERINELIINTNDYLRSCELCSSVLKNTTFLRIVIFLHTNRTVISRNEVNALIYMLNLKKIERLSPTGTHVIEVYEKNSSEMYGQFICTEDDSFYGFNLFQNIEGEF